jgi:hypothetical protein
MDIDKLFESDSLDGIADNVFGVVNNSVSEVKEMQRKKVAENVQLVVNALKKIESDISSRYDSVGNALEKRIITIKDGRDGADGSDGRNGRDGKNGRDGAPGPRGADGKNGLDGADGTDGVSVTNAHIDFDGSLVISLSSGHELNVGEVVAPALAEQIKVITNGGGTSQSVIDTLASLQAQITAISGASIYKGLWNASTNTPTLTSSVGTSGNFYIVSVAGSTNLNGITNWGVGDWAIYNGTAWQRVEGGAAGNFTTVTASSLTSGRVTYAGTAGLLQDSANLTFNGTTLTASYLDISNITAERIPYNAGTGGLTVSSNLQFTGDNTLVVSGITIGKGAGNMSFNSAFGYRAIYATATGNYNTALGAYAATATTTGQANSFSGYSAGARNTTGSYNSVVGYNAYADPLLLGTFGTGSYNCALGNATLISNTTGAGNIAIGTQSLGANTTGSYSTSVGYNAGLVVVGATNAFFGYNAGSTMTSGNYNVIIGSYTGASTPISNTGSNYIVLSDGQANVRAYWNGANATFNGALTAGGFTTTGATATGTLSATGNVSGANTTGTISSAASGVYATSIGNCAIFANSSGAATTIGHIVIARAGVIKGYLGTDSSDNLALIDGVGSVSLSVSSSTIIAAKNITCSAAAGQLYFSGASYGQVAAVGHLYLDAGAAKDIYFRPNGSALAMTLDSSGNLLVGGTAQSGTANRVAVFSANKFGLSVIDTTAQATGVGGALNLGGNYRAAGDAQAFARVAAVKQNSTDTDYGYGMAFSVTPNGGTFTEAGRFDSSGNLLVGTTTNPNGSKSIVKGTNGDQFEMDNDGSRFTSFYLSNSGTVKVSSYWDNTNAYYKIVPVTNGVYLSSGGVAWVAVSDERFKDIIEPIENAAEKLSGLRAIVGKYKTDEEGIRRSFLIAQDVQAVFPEAVDSTNQDELGLRYQDLIPVLVKAIQELSAKVAALEAK